MYNAHLGFLPKRSLDIDFRKLLEHMSTDIAAATLTNSVLERLEELIGADDFVRPTDNLLSEFEFKSLLKKSDSLSVYSEKFLIKALLHMHYDRDVKKAIEYFEKSIYHDSESIVAWTHFPAVLSARGFEVESCYFFKKAVEHVKSSGTLFNLFNSSVEAKDINSISLAINDFCKMYPEDAKKEGWVEHGVSFISKAIEQAEHLELDTNAITEALTAIKGYLGSLGYLVKAVRHYFDKYREEAFTIYQISNLTDDEANHLNYLIADFVVDNDFWDLKLSVVIEGMKEEVCEVC